MNEIALCIPSYRRPQIFSSSTYNLISKLQLPIYVFLKDMKDFDDYTNHPNYNWGSVHINFIITHKVGIGATRDYIRAYFPVGTKIIQLDDDINAIKQKDNNDFNLKDFIYLMFETMKKEETNYASLCLYHNTFFMKEGYSTNLKYCGCFFAEIITEEKIITPIDQYEDFFYSLKVFQRDKKIIRFNDVYVESKWYNPIGGICEDKGGLENRKKICDEISKDLINKYPKAMSRYLKKDNIWNIRLNAYYKTPL